MQFLALKDRMTKNLLNILKNYFSKWIKAGSHIITKYSTIHDQVFSKKYKAILSTQ